MSRETTEITVNGNIVYLYEGKVKMINLNKTKSQHGWSSNSYKVQGKKRPYVIAQKEKFYLDELEIEEITPIYCYSYKNREEIKTIIGEMTVFKQR